MNHYQSTIMISTCGTSFLTNGAKDDMPKMLNKAANQQKEEFSEGDLLQIHNHLEERKQLLHTQPLQEIRKLSAELNGLIGFYDDKLNQAKQDHHVLIQTDTYLGEIIAQTLKDWLLHKGLSVEIYKPNDLCTNNLQSFHHGIGELINWCGNNLPTYRDNHYIIIFNLVGGFKSIQGFMQTIGMLYADEILYIFETTKELLRIPRLPIDIDSAAEEHILQNLSIFRLLDITSLHVTPTQCHNIRDIFLYQFEDQVDLSNWGKLIWRQLKHKLYSAKLHQPPINQIMFTNNFIKIANQQDPKRLYHINERVDDLTQFILTNHNPNRLDFKRLKGNPKPPATHECDAWADQNAWRIFFHYENNHLILDHLGPGLH